MALNAVRWLVIVCWLGAGGTAMAQETPASQPADSPILDLAVGEHQTLSFPSAITRFLIGDSKLVTGVQTSPTELDLTAQSAGRTFVIVWTEEARTTTSLLILPVRPPPPTPSVEARQDLIEHADSLKVGYETSYGSVHRGENVEKADQETTTTAHHILTHEFETPVGMTSSQVKFRRVNTSRSLETWWVKLADGDLGWFKDFDAIAGDATLPFTTRAFGVPSGLRYRGASLRYRDLAPWHTATFWGRERTGALALPSGELGEDPDAFVYGFHAGLPEPVGMWKTEAAAMFGYGDDRRDTQSNQVYDLVTTLQLLESWSLTNELGLSEGNFGYTVGSSWKGDHAKLATTFRDINEQFQTVTGAGGGQGERGLSVDASWSPMQPLNFHGTLDVFKTRLFPNPEEPDALNLSANLDADWTPWESTSLAGFLSRRRDLGTISPNEDLRVGLSWGQRVPLQPMVPFLNHLTLSNRFEHQETRNVTSPTLDTDLEIASINVAVPLFWGLTANAGYQRYFLEETFTGARSEPNRWLVGLSHFSSFGQGQWQLRSRVAYEDEANTESPRSPLAGQDRITSTAGLRYRPSSSVELSVDGRVQHTRFEDAAQEGQLEFSIFTGAKLLFDTHVVRWDPTARIQGVVFHDLNGDGVRQAGEDGLEDILVMAGTIKEAFTDEEGRFVLGKVSGKTIPVSVDLASLPQGFVVSTPQRYVIRPEEQPSAVVVFGALGRAEIRGRVFYDVDGNGRYSAADQGVEDVRLQLNGHQAHTDRSGWFFFRDLPGGRYTFSLMLDSLPVKYLPLVPLRQSVEVEEGQTVTLDLPVTIRRVLEGRVYLDHNQNRRFDIGEETIAEMPVCLDGQRVAATDSQGLYRFPEIALGQHTLAFNCGMPVEDLWPLSSQHPVVTIGPDDPEQLTVDFRLERPATLIDEMIEQRRNGVPEGLVEQEDVTEL